MGVDRSNMAARFIVAALFASCLIAAALADEATPTAVSEDEFDPVKDGTKEMEEMDTNKDGKATVDELKAFMKARYYTKEEDLKDLENDDGKPATPEDIVKMVDRDATELVTELDKDKSGSLSLEEVIAQYKEDPSAEDDVPPEEGEDPADESADEAGAEEPTE